MVVGMEVAVLGVTRADSVQEDILEVVEAEVIQAVLVLVTLAEEDIVPVDMEEDMGAMTEGKRNY